MITSYWLLLAWFLTPVFTQDGAVTELIVEEETTILDDDTQTTATDSITETVTEEVSYVNIVRTTSDENPTPFYTTNLASSLGESIPQVTLDKSTTDIPYEDTEYKDDQDSEETTKNASYPADQSTTTEVSTEENKSDQTNIPEETSTLLKSSNSSETSNLSVSTRSATNSSSIISTKSSSKSSSTTSSKSTSSKSASITSENYKTVSSLLTIYTNGKGETVTQYSNATSHDSGNNKSVIIGCAVGIGAPAIIGAIVLGLCYYKKRNTPPDHTGAEWNDDDDARSQNTVGPSDDSRNIDFGSSIDDEKYSTSINNAINF